MPVLYRSASTFSSVVCVTVNIMVKWDENVPYLSGARLAHQRRELARNDISRHIVQELAFPIRHRYGIVEMLPRERIVHLGPFRDGLLLLRIVHGIGRPSLVCDLRLLLVGTDGGSCLANHGCFRAALEESDVGGAGDGRVELGEDEQEYDEANPEGEDDAKV
jgi:hypothetical protein